MGMGSAPCSGYVKKVTPELLKFLGITKLMVTDRIEELGAGTDPLDPIEAITDLIQSGHGPEIAFKTRDEYTSADSVPQGEEVRFFYYDSENGDRYDDLEDGLYAYFDEDSLWERSPTDFLTRLKGGGFEPEKSSWTNFG